mmetsp:Transcript_30552/g.49790  ORF Transcript_30552/g.49790 Transcript_30552/m.49790 type:complete len:731 (-) Transcript_30552:567-2759(-)
MAKAPRASLQPPPSPSGPTEYEDSSRGAMFIWLCVWIADIILGCRIEHYASVIMGGSVLYTSFRNQIITENDLSMIVCFAGVTALVCYVFMSEWIVALSADLVLLGYASFTLTKADAVMMLPILCIFNTLVAPLFSGILVSPLLLCISIGIGVPLVAISELSDFSDSVEEGKDGQIEQQIIEADEEGGMSLDFSALSESLGTSVQLLSNFFFVRSMELMSLMSSKKPKTAINDASATEISSPLPPIITENKSGEERGEGELKAVAALASVIQNEPLPSDTIDDETALEQDGESMVVEGVVQGTVLEPVMDISETKAEEVLLKADSVEGVGEGAAGQHVTLRRSMRRRKTKGKASTTTTTTTTTPSSPSPGRKKTRAREFGSVREAPREMILYLSGEDLRPMSSWRKTIDAYVEIIDEKRREIARTSVKKGSLCPRWLPLRIVAAPGERLELRVLHMGVVSAYPLGVTYIRIPPIVRLPCNFKRDLYAEGRKVMYGESICRLDIHLHPAAARATSMTTRRRRRKKTANINHDDSAAGGVAGEGGQPSSSSSSFSHRKDGAEAAHVSSRTRAKLREIGGYGDGDNDSKNDAHAADDEDDREEEDEEKNGHTSAKVAAIYRLQYGSMGYKHTSKGRKMRWIKLSKDMQVIEWWAPDRSKKRGGICVTDIVAVAPGWQTSVFQKASATMTPGMESKCFSIVCGSKTLDLEMNAVGVRKQWVVDVGLLTGKRTLT